jgi:hypothetical protein
VEEEREGQRKDGLKDWGLVEERWREGVSMYRTCITFECPFDELLCCFLLPAQQNVRLQRPPLIWPY